MGSIHRIASEHPHVAKYLTRLMAFCMLVSSLAGNAIAMQSYHPNSQATMQPALVNFSNSNAPQQGYEVAQGSYLESRVAELEAQVHSLQVSTSNGFGNSPVFENGRAGFYLGAASVWAKPHFKEAFQHSQTNVMTGQQTLLPFKYDYEATPKFWVGFRNRNGVGVRGTHWSFDATGESSTNTADGVNIFGAHAITIIFPANIFAAIPGATLQNQDSLEAEITNLYATYDMTFNGMDISGGVGLRYARLLQTLSSTVSGPLPASLNWTREYNGVGPAVSLDMTKPIGCTRFSAVAMGSGSFLFGTKTINRTVFGDMSPQPASPFLTLAEADEVVGIGEFGFGLQWSATTAGGSEMVVRGTYEGQLWAEAGAPTLGFLGFEGFGIQAEFRR